MIQFLHDGTGDRAQTLAASLFDFDDMTQIFDAPAPTYNQDRATYADDYDSRIDDNGSKWFGNLSCKQDAVDLVLNGWEKGSAKSSEASLTLEGTIAAVEAIRRRPRWGEEGEDMCVDRVLAGDWDRAFVDNPRVRTNGTKIVTLAGSVGGDCNRNAEELFWNGMQLMVVSDMLEAAGYQTEVWGVNLCNQSGSVHTLVGARAKIAGEPMRLDTMASVFAHAGIFRTFFFSAMARSHTPVNSGFGFPRMSVASITYNLDTAANYGWMPRVDVVMGEAYSRDSAIKNILATLKYVTE